MIVNTLDRTLGKQIGDARERREGTQPRRLGLAVLGGAAKQVWKALLRRVAEIVQLDEAHHALKYKSALQLRVGTVIGVWT